MGKPKFELSWIPALRQGRKRRNVNGKPKTFYLGTGNGKSDREGYDRPLAKWRGIEDVLDNGAAKRAAMREAFNALDAPIPADDSPQAEAGRQAALRALDPERYGEGNQKMLPSLVDEYVREQQRRFEHGEKFPNAPQHERIGAQRFIANRYNAELLKAAWANVILHQDEAGMARAMLMFKDATKDLLAADAIKEATYGERIKTVRHFVGWLHDNYHIPTLPRKISEICAKYRGGDSTARALDVATIRAIWTNADSRLKCYIALALNCGYYAIDIATLEHADVRGGYIVCGRHKTGVPTRFKLWDVTQKLLKQNRSKHAALALVARDDDALLRIDPHNKTGKGKRWCEIENDLLALKSRMKLVGVSFSNFRDTSSTKIEEIDRSLTDQFDSHKDRRMARFYIDHGKLDRDLMFAKLDAATDALERYYGLELNVGVRHEPRPALSIAS